ncbi:putative unknown membrane associated protein [Polaribacter irgensii 23-P]|uniref:YdbS-like PH domain-containing protein n=1 Tax=Polaribacter irgensii 23-P TaxID=313594 RepID=A4C2S9_9FLAO|nr:PH domain-containing protein [Polaribacter irgensii]EAR11603.1 putative unknown membrane associated protein [Polaribacter irgensii 23-P]
MPDFFQNNTVTTFPEVAKIDFKSIHNKYFKVIVIQTTLLFVALFLVAFIINYKAVVILNFDVFWLYTLLSLAFITVLFLKVIGFKKRKYAVREKDISYKKGVLLQSLTTVPFNRIQHVEIDQGPIARYFGFVSLSVFTAGDSSDDLKVPGLLKEEAEQIKEFISTKIDG